MTQELRKLAAEWIERECDEDDIRFDGGSTSINKLMRAYIAAANPAAILALLDRLEKAEKDAARLDWLQEHDKRYYNYDKIACFVGNGFAHGFVKDGVNSTLRGAIDSAMEASK